MTGGKINNFLIPNVSKLPGHKKVDGKGITGGNEDVNPNEFKELLKEQIDGVGQEHGIKLSVHAARRLHERNLEVDGDEFFKLKGAMDRLRDKGGQDSLVVTDKAAYILDVAQNTIVTAMDKEQLTDNVFTKIDSTLIIN